MKTGTVWSVVLTLVMATGAAGQQGIPPLSGMVQDAEGRPLANARLWVPGVERSAITDRSGRYVFRSLPSGVHRVQAVLMGYAPALREITVRSGEAAELHFTLRPTPLTLDEIQVTGTPAAAETRQVAQATAQLSGRALERNVSATVAQTLATQPGVRVRYNGPAAASPIMRGLSGDRILVLQDGQRSSDLAGSAVDHAVTIDPLTAQRIEVVRGPATLLYGNNALGGVVNVISGDVPGSVPLGVEGMATAQTESAYPGAGGSFRLTAGLGERWALTFRGGGRSAGDVRIGEDPELGDRLGNTDSRSRNGAMGIGYLGERINAGVFARGYDFAYGLPVPPGAEPIRLRGDRWEAGGRLQAHLASPVVSSLRADGTAQDYAHDELDRLGNLQMSFALRTQTLNVVLRQAERGAFSGAWGASVLAKQYASTGAGALTPAADSRTWGVFGFQEIALAASGLALQFGGRYDDYGISSRDSEKFGPGVDRRFRAFSGSAGVRLPVSTAASAAVTVSRSFRAPTVEELFSGALHAGTGSVEYGTPTLVAERGMGVEGVLRLRTDRWNGQFVLYRNRVDDYVHLLAQPDTLVGGNPVRVYRYVQDDATLQGAEASLEWAARRDLVLGATGDLLHAEHRDGTPLSFMPPPRLGGYARWDGGLFSLGGEFHHELEQTRVGSADEGTTEAHTMIRLDAGLRLSRGGLTHSLTLRVDNLADDTHREATSRIKDFAPGPGRNLALVYRVLF